MSNAVEVALRVLRELDTSEGQEVPAGGPDAVGDRIHLPPTAVLASLASTNFDLNEALEVLARGA